MTRQRYPLSEPEDVAIGWDNHTGKPDYRVWGRRYKGGKNYTKAQIWNKGTFLAMLVCLHKSYRFGFAGQIKGKAQADKQ